MTQKIAVGTKFMQEVNSSAILARLRAESPLSVSTLAQSTGLSRQAVSRSLAILEDDGYVEISEPERSATRAGRPAQMVRFRSELGSVLGIDVSPAAVHVVVADLSGETVGTATVGMRRGSADLARTLGEVIDRALSDAGVDAADVWHVSIAAPGIVDPRTGRVNLIPSMPSAAGDVLIDAVRSRVDCPVYVDNDVKLATQGERWRGSPRTESALVFVDWGERVGAGIVIGGELYRGASNDAGDIGYLDLLAPSTDLTATSELGPFEQWTGSGELLRIASRLRGAETTWIELVSQVERGADWAVAALDEVAGRFAKGVTALRALLDPETVVIGGAMADFGPQLVRSLERALAGEPLNQPRLEISALGPAAIVQGAIHHSLTTVQRERFGTPFSPS